MNTWAGCLSDNNKPGVSGGAAFRIATYNVHKCQGLDRRTSPARIAAVLAEINADIVALQEVLSIEDGAADRNQARFLANELGLHFHVGENRRLRGGAYGNVLLSRLPLAGAHNFDLTCQWRERRGCLRADVQVPGGGLLHIFNVHFGTAFVERRHQARLLISEAVLAHPEITGPRVVLGDFNEWTYGLASRLLASQLQSADIRHHLRRARTYPGVFPFLHLDHVYYDRSLVLERLTLHRNRTSLVASDHLPLVADFRFAAHPPR